jgi:nicotinamidase-related amidase
MITLEARPQPFTLDPSGCALLVIDLQVDFMEPGGWAEAVGLEIGLLAPVVPVIGALLETCRARGVRVIYTREGHRPDLADCPPWKRARHAPRVGDQGPRGRYMITGEPCNAVISSLRPKAEDIVVDKPGAGSFYATTLDQILRTLGVTQLLVTGVTADVCVNTTIREANDRGYECVLIEDAVASYDRGFTQAIIEMLRIGVAGYTTTAAAIHAALHACGPGDAIG